MVNGQEVIYSERDGYAIIDRLWESGDEIQFVMAMEVKEVVASSLVAENEGKIALERGPLVYCVEGIDNSGFDTISAAACSRFEVVSGSELLKDVKVVNAKSESEEQLFTAIPYYTWNNRGPSKMKVWIEN